jgi:hypothetical protein
MKQSDTSNYLMGGEAGFRQSSSVVFHNFGKEV